MAKYVMALDAGICRLQAQKYRTMVPFLLRSQIRTRRRRSGSSAGSTIWDSTSRLPQEQPSSSRTEVSGLMSSER